MFQLFVGKTYQFHGVRTESHSRGVVPATSGVIFHGRDHGRDNSIDERVSREIREYRALDQLPMYEKKNCRSNPLMWWKENCQRFPLLAVLARRTLCIPATSAPSERVFSTAGLTISKKRASMNSDNAADMIFLRGSWAQTEKFSAEVNNRKRKANDVNG